MQNNRLKIVEMTADESPTIRMDGCHQEPAYTEPMHHSRGAAAETVYIYGEGLRQALQLVKASELNSLVVGLGLGYIEFLIGLMTDFKFKQILSFERDLQLREDFKSWIGGSHSPSSIYHQVIESLMRRINKRLPVEVIQQQMNTSPLILAGSLERPFPPSDQRYHFICYDAFSSRMTPQLWESTFLHEFIQQYCADQCVFASYAQTGTLNRLLKEHGFSVQDRNGFAKRGSTLAIRK